MWIIVTAAILLHSYFDIWRHMPLIAARTPPGSAAAFAISMQLWTAIGIQTVVCVTFLLVPAIARSSPGAVHFGWRRLSDYSPRQRERIMPLLKRMMGILSVLTAVFFGAWIHTCIGNAVDTPRSPVPPVQLVWWTAGLVAVSALVTAYYLQRFDQAAGDE